MFCLSQERSREVANAKVEARAAVAEAKRAAQGFDAMAVVSNYYIHRWAVMPRGLFPKPCSRRVQGRGHAAAAAWPLP